MLICDKDAYKHEKELPLFAWKSQALAKQYYAPHQALDQLKDLKEREKSKANIDSEEEFCVHCAERLFPDELSAISPSFALFKEQIEQWHKE